MNVLIVSLAALFLVELVRYFRKQQLDAFLAEQNLWFRLQGVWTRKILRYRR